MKYVIVGTAGHIDHGKSALVRALTGIDPDRLEEEKRRGITIDLGFAHLELGEGLKVGFIDVPGHERFVRNMLAGVGGIDLVMLVVAADESIKPQTREHFDICKLLGIKQGLIAITKSDLAEQEIIDIVKAEIQEFVAGSFLEGAPILAVSARTGEGLETLKSELRRLSLAISPRPTGMSFRLPVDRAFVMKGFGTVVTGTLIAGQIEKGAEVEILPLFRRARVRGIQVHNQPSERAVAGQRTALNLVGVEARELARGMTLAPPGLFENTHRLDCVLTLLRSAPPLKHRARVHFHCWSAETLAEAALLNAKELKPGERAYAQLRLAEPGLFLPGDRFIIRQFSPVITIGGGTLLDNQPPQHKPRDSQILRFLAVMEVGGEEERLELMVRQAGEVSLVALTARTGWQLSEILRVSQALANKKLLLILGQPATHLAHAEHSDALAQKLIETLQTFHAANPLDPGMTKEELRGRLASTLPSQAASPSVVFFNALLQRLSAAGRIHLQGETVRLMGREIHLSPEELAAKAEISRAFEKAGLAVPSAREVLASLQIDRARGEKILQILLKERMLMKVAEDLIFHQSALRSLREMLARQKGKSKRLNVATFKELTGLSRKYAIPLLEHLDRERITRREGDERIIL